MSTPYTTHVLPSSDTDIAAYAQAYSQLRLKGLKQSPDSFSSTFEEELGLSDDEKIARFQREKKRNVIIAAAVNPAEEGEGTHLCAREWVGSVTILGPMTQAEYLAPFKDSDFKASWPTMMSTSPAKDSINTKENPNPTHHQISYWHMTALYVDHNHRRQGLAKKLCDAAFQLIEQEKEETKGEHSLHELRIIIKPENTGVVQMYENLGFAPIQDLKATLAEAVTASGEADVDEKILAGNPKYTRRGGLIMLKHI